MASVLSSLDATGAMGAPASHPYTCNTCQVAYRNIDLQKGHMKSDWHRYNLKRRVASLPPLSAEIFTEKVIQARAESTAEADKAYFERSCDVCNKTYYSENAYQNHLSSQKHKLNEAATPNGHVRNEDETKSMISSTFSLGEPTSVAKDTVDSDAEDEFNQVIEGLQKAKLAHQRPSPVSRPSNPRPGTNGVSDDVDEEEEEESGDEDAKSNVVEQEQSSSTPAQSTSEPAWTLRSCIFCNYDSPTVPLNAHHMERFHGMFIPEKQYLVDLDGLIQQLQFKVLKGNQCLFCDKIKSNVYATQTHMRDIGHCKIPYNTEAEQLEIGDYYDFRSTYSDGAESDSEEEEAGGARVRKPDDGNEKGDKEDADGWETDSSASSLDSEDLTAVPAEGHIHQFERLSKHPHHSRDDPRPRHQADGWHSRAHKHTHAVFYDDYELHLPSGKSVGHRSLNKYYRQNLNNYPTTEEREERQAIEASAEQDGHGSDDNQVTVRGGRGRAVVPRGAVGMAGASEEKKRVARKEGERGRKLQDAEFKNRKLAYGVANNKQKHFNYFYDRGG